MAVPFDRVAKIYDATRWSGVPPEVMARLFDSMKESFANCRSILDIGIGTGRFAQYFEESGFDVIGIDLSLPMMIQAREKRVRNLVRADAHYLPFRNQSIDGAIMIHVLHLVKDWVKVVNEVGRVTRRVLLSEAGDVEGFSARQKYLEARTSMGYPINRLNDGEFELCRIVPPRLRLRAGDYWTDVKTDDDIRSLDQKKNSVIWDMPADVHARIMEELQAEYGGKTFKRHDIVEVVGWDPQKLRDFRSSR